MARRKKAPRKRKEIEVSCAKCRWMYSTSNNHCPMCGAPLLLNHEELVRALQEYVELQGSWIVKKEAKKFIDAYKDRYKKLPDLDTLWNTAVKLAKIEEMSQEEIDKAKRKQAAQEDDEVKKKMQELQQKKIQAQQEENKKKKRKLRKKKKKQKKQVSLVCPKCNETNPADSKFCLNCGNQLGE